MQLDAIRFKIDKLDLNRVKFAMFPDSFPLAPGHFPALLHKTPESEILDLFSSWVDVPLTEPGVIRVIEAYIPMKLQARQFGRPNSNPPTRRADWDTLTSVNVVNSRTTGCVPHVTPGSQTKRRDVGLAAAMDSGKETWHLLFIDGKATWVKDPQSSRGDAGGASSPLLPRQALRSQWPTWFRWACECP